eukprot:TRINITY_DN1572_c0_g1_i1.p3 TRINITY_DN1572_c0_g1~~TRINITY_DN1572_c0_g1_i1.p3  ORF type:complete len:108 (-),score=32.06 TRINITY_DN1572_c0_g1_i1:10-333(-)
MKLALLPAKTTTKTGSNLSGSPTPKRQTALEQVIELSSSKAASNLLDGPQLEQVLASAGLEEDKEAGALYEPLSNSIGAESVSAGVVSSPPSLLVLVLVATIVCWLV